MPPARWSRTSVVEPAGRAVGQSDGAATPGALADDAAVDRAFLIRASLVAMAVAALACLLVHLRAVGGGYGPIGDALFVEPYWRDGTAIAAGHVPYRDFPLEYPPFSLPAFLLPIALPGGGIVYTSYRWAFEVLMAACVVALVPVVAWTVARLRPARLDVWLAVGFVALSPILLGSLMISRYDIWPALLTAVATLAAVSGRHRVAFAVLALAVLAKVYPIF